jgi:hypothetical protein
MSGFLIDRAALFVATLAFALGAPAEGQFRIDGDASGMASPEHARLDCATHSLLTQS